MSVKRYTNGADDDQGTILPFMEESPNGDYVEYADYAALERRLAEVEAELKEANEKLKYTYCAWCGQGIEISDVERAKEFIADHVRSCPDHPYAELQAENKRLREIIQCIREWVAKAAIAAAEERGEE